MFVIVGGADVKKAIEMDSNCLKVSPHSNIECPFLSLDVRNGLKLLEDVLHMATLDAHF